MIPKILHQIWMQGSSKVPEKYRQAQESWKILHPDWTFCVWDEEACSKVAKGTHWEAVLEKCTLMIQKADVYRCVLLEVFGGVYADMDMIALKNLESLMTTDRIHLGKCEGSIRSAFLSVNNGIIFCPARLEIWKEVAQEILEAIEHPRLSDCLKIFYVLRTAGPLMWKRVVDKFPWHFTLHDKEYFYSLQIAKKLSFLTDEDKKLLINSYAYHMQSSDWVDGWERILMLVVMNKFFVLFVVTLILLYVYSRK